jgi:hypothetical protein
MATAPERDGTARALLGARPWLAAVGRFTGILPELALIVGEFAGFGLIAFMEAAEGLPRANRMRSVPDLARGLLVEHLRVPETATNHEWGMYFDERAPKVLPPSQGVHFQWIYADGRSPSSFAFFDLASYILSCEVPRTTVAELAGSRVASAQASIAPDWVSAPTSASTSASLGGGHQRSPVVVVLPVTDIWSPLLPDDDERLARARRLENLLHALLRLTEGGVSFVWLLLGVSARHRLFGFASSADVLKTFMAFMRPMLSETLGSSILIDVQEFSDNDIDLAPTVALTHLASEGKLRVRFRY